MSSVRDLLGGGDVLSHPRGVSSGQLSKKSCWDLQGTLVGMEGCEACLGFENTFLYDHHCMYLYHSDKHRRIQHFTAWQEWRSTQVASPVTTDGAKNEKIPIQIPTFNEKSLHARCFMHIISDSYSHNTYPMMYVFCLHLIGILLSSKMVWLHGQLLLEVGVTVVFSRQGVEAGGESGARVVYLTPYRTMCQVLWSALHTLKNKQLTVK